MRIFRAMVIIALLLALPALAMHGDVNELLSGELLAAWQNGDGASPAMEMPKIEMLPPEQVAVMPEFVPPEVVAEAALGGNNAQFDREVVDQSAGRKLRAAVYRPMSDSDNAIIRRMPAAATRRVEDVAANALAP